MRVEREHASKTEDHSHSEDENQHACSPIESTYNDFLLQKISEIFNKTEKEAFLIASDQKRPTTIRINTLRETRESVIKKLINRGINIEPIKWNNCSAVVYNSDIPIGATPEYLAGSYILQSPTSTLAAIALNPTENETVVDMCAAPGGKTTHLAALMNNTGTLYANDVCPNRALSLVANLQRMGVTNSIVTVLGGRGLPYSSVDKVLLDAPCSGTGVISKDQMIKRNKTEKDIKKLQYQQMALLLKGFDMLDAKSASSVLVYSTCSILVEENEYVVDNLLKKRKNARLVETELPIGEEGFKSYRGWVFHPSLRMTRRFYPHTHNTDGFFIAKIKKIGFTDEEIAERKRGSEKKSPENEKNQKKKEKKMGKPGRKMKSEERKERKERRKERASQNITVKSIRRDNE
ncbi:uncharacterized protein NESG_00515 [Nematocida ausubeli]|uniref:SAM-dependent MTase RsmB/NOP-type domain-containing protein n=1 Tax=Nematocida ausubeli (strain ATCC PRA-371 / ERTm2) TaxID=1913371 RepID=A0A086J5L8_NEMA1|nr:uncharacterized protein NESG_00515 [Nematocida ausubeli]KFG27436.1 hypothetical protein NESG_00515 [Nematocida ausubeli]